ncbi:MAG: hypothetical protein OQL19_04545 [Gammaproteobacteria bacterium]|nr:hypothetical protein [Gammaproteobacteria bacterium]
MDIDNSTIDDLITKCWASVKNKVEHGTQPVSSEKTLVFLFAMELVNSVGKNLIIDFENQCYSNISGESKYLDLLFYTNHDFKVAIEFKFPVGTPDQKDTRKKIYRDIGRLKYLKDEEDMKACYFVMATNIDSYLNNGNYQDYIDIETAHNHTITEQNDIEVDGIPLYGVKATFSWDNIKTKKFKTSGREKYVRDGKYAWLQPIKI